MTSPGGGSGPVTKQFGSDCWSCRLLGGGGLIAAGGYVYAHARKAVRGGNIAMGTAAQIMFAMGVASWGVVIIAKSFENGSSNVSKVK